MCLDTFIGGKPHIFALCLWSPGILLPGTFMYSWTVFMPRMVWPTWLSRFPAETTRAKAGSLLSSCSCCFHLVDRVGKAPHQPLLSCKTPYLKATLTSFHRTRRCWCQTWCALKGLFFCVQCWRHTHKSCLYIVWYRHFTMKQLIINLMINKIQ